MVFCERCKEKIAWPWWKWPLICLRYTLAVLVVLVGFPIAVAGALVGLVGEWFLDMSRSLDGTPYRYLQGWLNDLNKPHLSDE